MPRPLAPGLPLPGPALRPGRAPSRSLFAWDADDARLVSGAGQAATFARAGAGTTIDATGAVRGVGTDQPRWVALDLDGDGRREAVGLLIEGPSRNLVPYGDRLSQWTGSSIAASDGWLPLGDVALARLVSSTTGALAYTAVLNASNGTTAPFASGAGPRALSVIVAPSALPAPGLPAVALYDQTAGAYRLLARYAFDAAGAPVVTVVVGGSYLGAEPLAAGAWRLLFRTASVTAANAHRVFVYPDGGSGTGDVGDMLVGGVQVEDRAVPTSLIPTPGATTVARATETCVFPLDARPQDATAYVALARPVWAGLTTGQTHAPLAAGVIGTTGALLHDGGTGVLHATRYDAGAVADASVAAPAATRGVHREVLDWAGRLTGWGSRGAFPTVAVQADTGRATASNAGYLPFAAWGGDLRLHGWVLDGSTAPDAVLLAVRLAPGVRTLDEMRGLR